MKVHQQVNRQDECPKNSGISKGARIPFPENPCIKIRIIIIETLVNHQVLLLRHILIGEKISLSQGEDKRTIRWLWCLSAVSVIIGAIVIIAVVKAVVVQFQRRWCQSPWQASKDGWIEISMAGSSSTTDAGTKITHKSQPGKQASWLERRY